MKKKSASKRTAARSAARGAVLEIQDGAERQESGSEAVVHRSGKVADPTADPLDSPATAEDKNPLPIWVPLDLIDFSPLNYRKYYDPVALQEFAEGLKAQGIISPVTVRVVTPGRYELVVGERRIRGGRVAGLAGTPAVLRTMTDEQVEEAQLAENVGREDSHAMHDAEAIARMYKRGLTTDEIALRLGKSRTFVYQRRRLSALLPDFQEMFLAGVISHNEALDIALLPPDAQLSMYTEWCADWKERDRTQLDYHRITSSFKCDLRRAQFDLADTTIYPEAGACTVCPHNSGFSGLLFANENGDARCGKKACFDMKCRLHIVRVIVAGIAEHAPTAIIIGRQVPDLVKEALSQTEGAKDLPTHVEDDISFWDEPEAPKREDYLIEDWDQPDYDYEQDMPEEGQQEGETQEIDEEAYAAAVAEYEEDLASYKAAIEDGKVYKAFHLSGGHARIVYFSPVPKAQLEADKGGKKVKVQDLIKAGLDTPEMLEAEIKRIKEREDRYQELDREKVQKQVHEQLSAQIEETTTGLVWKDSDRSGLRWIAYFSLPYSAKARIEEVLGLSIDDRPNRDKVYEAFSQMTPEQEAYLGRLAMLENNQSKLPTTMSGFFLYKTAEGAGIDVQAIELKQATKAQNRRDNQEVKVTLYKKRIKRHRRKAA